MKCRCYLDIETTGLSRNSCALTVIGLAFERAEGLEVVQLVGDEISDAALMRAMEPCEKVYTYNGSRFDLPFIKTRLGVDIRGRFEHVDLMYACWKHNLKGGLKAVERKLGIGRELPEIDGFMAVRLWWDYVNRNDRIALERLLEYNRQDVINLKGLREKLSVD